MRATLSFLIGLLFGFGLCASGMTQPSKVQGFLDLAGSWDPSLALVMGGAVGVGVVLFGVAARRRKSLLGDLLPPAANGVDKRLLFGAAIFGVGWGLSGVCPGPAIVNLGHLEPHALVFFAAMCAGMAIERLALSVLPSVPLETAECDVEA